MCGICGIVATPSLLFPRPLTSAWRRCSNRSRTVVRTRSASVRRVRVLGATRLAIRGLADGAQPMVDPDTRIVVVCNGESIITAKTGPLAGGTGTQSAQPDRRGGDSRPLISNSARSSLGKLVGAFAVAVWDPRFRRLTLARDRAGERPIFFAVNGGENHFRHRACALVAHGRLPSASIKTP